MTAEKNPLEAPIREILETIEQQSMAIHVLASEIAAMRAVLEALTGELPIPEPEPEPDPLRACPGCGHGNHPDAPFCFECGRDVDSDHPNHWYCVRCGQKMGPASIACGRYGCNLERKRGQGTGPDPFQGSEIPQSPVAGNGPPTK